MAPKARNMVIEGDYQYQKLGFKLFKNAFTLDGREFQSTDVEKVTVIDWDDVEKIKKKHAGARALLGGVLFGPVGAIAGAASGMGKKAVRVNGTHQLLVEFTDGKQCIMEVDDSLKTIVERTAKR